MTAIGELNRMHQFRDKSLAQRELVSAALLFYPVLQAADVLAYRAHEVPVGEDQREHLELMRDVARRFNARFGEDILVVPEHRIPEVGARIMDLQEPARKMSTTGGTPEGTVLVLDDPATIEKKIKRAVTDSGSEIVRAADKPGVTNLIDILAVARGRDAGGRRGRHGLGARLRRPQGGDGDRRRRRCSRPFASATPSCAATRTALEAILAEGAGKARAMARATLADVRAAMGFGPPRLSAPPCAGSRLLVGADRPRRHDVLRGDHAAAARPRRRARASARTAPACSPAPTPRAR